MLSKSYSIIEGCCFLTLSILEQHTQKGFAKEAMSELLRYCQAEGVKKVFAFTHPENTSSEKLAYALGMKFMGTRKKEDLPFLANHFEKLL